MKTQILAICLCMVLILVAAAYAAPPYAVVTIYVDDNNGNQMATGSGVVIAEDGLIATDINLLHAWLGTEDNSLFVRTGQKGYYPIASLVSMSRENNLAIFRIAASGLNTAVPSVDSNYSVGDKIYIALDNGVFETQPIEGTISSIREDGMLELSVSSLEGLRGPLVLNSRGEAIGIVSVQEGVALAVPLSHVIEIASEGLDKAHDSSPLNRANIKKAKTAVESNRASAEDYLRLGAAYEKAGLAENAINAFKRAIELKPNYAEAYHGLGVAYAGEGMYEEAAAALEQAVKTDPKYAKALGNLGFLYDYLGRHGEAIASFARAIEINPEYAEAYNGLGVSLAKEKYYEKAIEAFTHALEFMPEFKKARFNLGLSYISLDDKESALHQEALLRMLDPEMADKLHEMISFEDDDEETHEEDEARSESDADIFASNTH